ncbi:MAG: hypothetical protein ACYTG1_10195 [Planctomycetota bacterium]|jgi:hypothetical protein
MLWTVARGLIAGAIVVAVLSIPKDWPRLRALVLTLPVVSIIAFAMAWQKDRDLPAIAALARETLVLVPLGLPFFVPIAFAKQWGLGFWSAAALGLLLAATTIGLWFWLGPRPGGP